MSITLLHDVVDGRLISQSEGDLPGNIRLEDEAGNRVFIPRSLIQRVTQVLALSLVSSSSPVCLCPDCSGKGLICEEPFSQSTAEICSLCIGEGVVEKEALHKLLLTLTEELRDLEDHAAEQSATIALLRAQIKDLGGSDVVEESVQGATTSQEGK